jgi:hypothetical protein
MLAIGLVDTSLSGGTHTRLAEATDDEGEVREARSLLPSTGLRAGSEIGVSKPPIRPQTRTSFGPLLYMPKLDLT